MALAVFLYTFFKKENKIGTTPRIFTGRRSPLLPRLFSSLPLSSSFFGIDSTWTMMPSSSSSFDLSAPIRRKKKKQLGDGGKHHGDGGGGTTGGGRAATVIPPSSSFSLIGNMLPPGNADVGAGSKHHQHAFLLERGSVVVFPNPASCSATMRGQRWWEPPKSAVTSPNDGALTLRLDHFVPFDDKCLVEAGTTMTNDTVLIRASVPSTSKRFSFNIALADTSNSNSFDNVLFHFNPRQYEKGGILVLNDKNNGTWGKAVNVPLSEVGPLIFGQQKIEIAVRISGGVGRTAGGTDGLYYFDVFIGDKHCARLQRCPKPPEFSTAAVRGGERPKTTTLLRPPLPPSFDKKNPAVVTPPYEGGEGGEGGIGEKKTSK